MSNRNRQNNQLLAQVKQIANQVAQKAASNVAKPNPNRRRNRGNRNGNTGPNRSNGNNGQNITFVGRALRTVGSIAGGMVGSAKGGEALGAGISRIFGQGDYQVQSNSLVKGGPPSFAAMSSGIRIAHREFITDVVSSTGFVSTQYPINPSNSGTFPWLSKMALNFEQYVIKGVVFYFNTTSGNAISGTNNALGTVGMVTCYDPSKPAFSSKRQCEDYAGCVSGSPSAALLHPVECAPGSGPLNRYYVQTTNMVNPEDLKNYAIGGFNLFTSGMQASGITIGELWVSYDIEFYNPKILPIGTVESAATFGYNQFTTQTTTQVMGTNNFTGKGNLGAYYQGSDGTFRIPQGTAQGYYQLVLYYTTAVGFSTSLTPGISSTNIGLYNAYAQNSASSVIAPNGATGTAWHSFMVMVNKLDTNEAYFSVNQTQTSAGTVFMDWQLVKIPSQAFTGSTNSYFVLEADDQFDLLYKKFKNRFFSELGGQIHDDIRHHEDNPDEFKEDQRQSTIVLDSPEREQKAPESEFSQIQITKEQPSSKRDDKRQDESRTSKRK